MHPLLGLKTEIQESLTLSKRTDSPTLIAVSKSQPAEAIEALIPFGQRDFGENYLQEAQAKIALLAPRYSNLTWHFIGHIQRNKTRTIAQLFDWVHTLDRFEIAERLNHQRPLEKVPLNVCIQLNLDQEPQKSGVHPEALLKLATQILTLPRLKLRGLMTIPKPRDSFEAQRMVFAEARSHFERLKQEGLPLDTLSMGMSQDFKAALLEGSTCLRIGTRIFGARETAVSARG